MVFCEEKVTCLYLDIEEQINSISMLGLYCGGWWDCRLSLDGQCEVKMALSVSKRSQTGEMKIFFFSLLKLARFERKELKDPFLKI